MKPVIAIVLPCFNEEEVLPISVPRILSVIDRMSNEGIASADSYILCCNDGSTDRTWQIIEQLNHADRRVKGISLAHNRGHQNVLLAGLLAAKDTCDAAVSIDADLQDDPDAIVDMVRAFNDGKEIVYGVRSDRSTDSWFKRSSAHLFYLIQQKMGVDTVYDHADFRLMSRRAIEMLGRYGESNLFLRGIIPQIGLETAKVAYRRHPRAAGESKYPFFKMLNFSVDGITSFSAKPIRWIFTTGLILLGLDILVAVWVLVSYFSGHVIGGWASIMVSLWFLGSLILMSIGIVGEYIGKIFMEVKKRPRFEIADKIN